MKCLFNYAFLNNLFNVIESIRADMDEFETLRSSCMAAADVHQVHNAGKSVSKEKATAVVTLAAQHTDLEAPDIIKAIESFDTVVYQAYIQAAVNKSFQNSQQD